MNKVNLKYLSFPIDHESLKSIGNYAEREDTAEGSIDRHTINSKENIAKKNTAKESEIKSELRHQKSMLINQEKDFDWVIKIVKNCNKLYDPYLIKRNWPNNKVKRKCKSKIKKIIDL